MLARFAAIPLALAITSLSGVALAQKPAPAKGADAAPAADGVKRDPNGVKGISPFWEAIKKGDDAYVARDMDGAIAAYRDAITKEPQNALGHYRMGEVQLTKGDMKEADASWANALRFVGSDWTLKGKILACIADLRERQKSYDDANDSWTQYETLAKEHTDAKTYPDTAAKRKQAIATWKQLLEDYGAVKKRIEQRLKEADEKAQKNAK
jgi:cytochrome c-type biogenesis protein CcmH/NrfG